MGNQSTTQRLHIASKRKVLTKGSHIELYRSKYRSESSMEVSKQRMVCLNIKSIGLRKLY